MQQRQRWPVLTAAGLQSSDGQETAMDVMDGFDTKFQTPTDFIIGCTLRL